MSGSCGAGCATLRAPAKAAAVSRCTSHIEMPAGRLSRILAPSLRRGEAFAHQTTVDSMQMPSPSRVYALPSQGLSSVDDARPWGMDLACRPEAVRALRCEPHASPRSHEPGLLVVRFGFVPSQRGCADYGIASKHLAYRATSVVVVANMWG